MDAYGLIEFLHNIPVRYLNCTRCRENDLNSGGAKPALLSEGRGLLANLFNTIRRNLFNAPLKVRHFRMSPLRVPSEDEMKLVQLEKKFSGVYKTAIAADENVEIALDILAKRVTDSIRAKKDLIAKMKDIESIMQDISRDPNAHINNDQTRDYSNLVARYNELLENNQQLVEGLKDIALAYKGFLGKKQVYFDTYQKYVNLKNDLQKSVYSYRKMTNRLQNDNKVKQLEDSLRTQDQELERLERDNLRQLQGLIDEGKAVDEAWLQLKDFIKEFSF